MLCTLQGGDQDQAPGGPEVAPSIHPKVPDTQYMSRGRRLGIRQSMGWEKVCGSARSGIWVLHGDLKSRMLPANLHHQSVRWRTGSTHTTRLWFIRVWSRSSSQTTNYSILWSSRCVVARRVLHPLRFGWTMVTSWSRTVWPNRSMCIPLCLGLHFPQVVLRSVGKPYTLCPAHWQAQFVVVCLRARKV